jgi:predicted ATP-grasp superfamily ATP-dependent carboligase
LTAGFWIYGKPETGGTGYIYQVLREFADKNREKTILAIGCGDSYVQLLSQNRDSLRKM